MFFYIFQMKLSARKQFGEDKKKALEMAAQLEEVRFFFAKEVIQDGFIK